MRLAPLLPCESSKVLQILKTPQKSPKTLSNHQNPQKSAWCKLFQPDGRYRHLSLSTASQVKSKNQGIKINRYSFIRSGAFYLYAFAILLKQCEWAPAYGDKKKAFAIGWLGRFQQRWHIPRFSIHKKVHNSVKLDEIPDFISDQIYSPAGAVIFHQLLLSRNFPPFWWRTHPDMCLIR